MDLLWKNCPHDWVILSMDWSANCTRRQQHTLTCQQARSCIIAPIVLQRSADPWTYPPISHLPHTAELIKEHGVQRGQRIRTLESHTFIFTTTDHKGPAVTDFRITTILNL